MCEVFDCRRSTYYYQTAQRDETAVVEAIEQVLMRRPCFGYRRVVAQLQRAGVQAGETVVRRLLKALGHSRSVGKVKVQTTDSRHSYTRYPNQVWVGDITYIRLGSQFLYLVVILDACSRALRGWTLSRWRAYQHVR